MALVDGANSLGVVDVVDVVLSIRKFEGGRSISSWTLLDGA